MPPSYYANRTSTSDFLLTSPLQIHHLLRELGDSVRAELERVAAAQRRKAGHEEVQSWKRHHIHGQLAQVGIQLAGEAQASSDARHRKRDQMVEVGVVGLLELECIHADAIERLVVDTERFISIL